MGRIVHLGSPPVFMDPYSVTSWIRANKEESFSEEVSMKIGWWIWTSTLLFVLLGTKAEAGRTLRDFSGDAMQRYDSRMMSSPMTDFPGIFGVSLWPYIAYPPAPSMTIVNVQVQFPELDMTPPTTPFARPKFWTARCGVFVELEASSTMNLMEEERKPCSP